MAEVEEIEEIEEVDTTKEEIKLRVIMKRLSLMIIEAIEEASEEKEVVSEEEKEVVIEEIEEPSEVIEEASEETEVEIEEWIKEEREETVVNLEQEEEALEKSMMVSILTIAEEVEDMKVAAAAVETDKTETKDTTKMTLEVITSTQKNHVEATLLTKKHLKIQVTDRITLLKVTIIDI